MSSLREWYVPSAWPQRGGAVACLCLGFHLFFLPLTGYASDSETAAVDVGIEPMGYASFPVATRGLFASYNFTPNSSLSVSYARGSMKHLLATYSSDLALIRYQQLFGSTFHAALGAGYRSFNYNFNVHGDGALTDADAAAKVAVLETSVGSRIALNNAFIGCDWLGVTLPVSRLSHASHFPDTTNPNEQTTDQATLDHDAFTPALEFMRVFVGVTF